MRQELHAEWTKLRTVTETSRLLLAIITLTLVLSAAASAAVTCPSAGCGHDTAKLSLAGIQLGQAAVAMLAVLAISSEFSTGMIRTTLTAMPRRATVLVAKAAILTGITLVAGTTAVLASVLAGRLNLPANGFTAAHGYPLPSLADGPMLRAAAGSVLYLALIALLSLGIAAAVRDSAAAMGIMLSLLYLFPIIVLMVSDPDWQRRRWQISPINAGLAIQATTNLSNLPLSPWTGLGGARRMGRRGDPGRLAAAAAARRVSETSSAMPCRSRENSPDVANRRACRAAADHESSSEWPGRVRAPRSDALRYSSSATRPESKRGLFLTSPRFSSESAPLAQRTTFNRLVRKMPRGRFAWRLR